LSWSSKSVDFITLFTEDLERSKAFYQDVFGLRLIFEDENSAVFRFANTGINVLRADCLPRLRHRGLDYRQRDHAPVTPDPGHQQHPGNPRADTIAAPARDRPLAE
jgi:catechol 2,3-dioxygenase-like lactoylglutathione lyase family enzyme